jgi:Zinc carboxypeptidase
MAGLKNQRKIVCCLFALAALMAVEGRAQIKQEASDLLLAESSQFKRTGPYAEVEASCQSLAKKYPEFVRCVTIGSTAEGRPIVALVVSRTGVLTPAQAKRAGIPVVLAIGGTHAGEIDGKDAGLILIRDMLKKSPAKDPLKHQVFLFVPVFNVDGHERPSPFNRPNQNGPSLQGERVTAQRINLNRDWMLGQTSEMNAMLQFITQWDPLVTLDLHVTDGVRFRHDVSLSMSPMFATDDVLHEVSDKFSTDMIERIQAKGHHPLDFTPVLLDFENPRAGIMRDADAPRFSHVYAVLRNRIGVLVEDHAWDPYAHRVQTSKDVLSAALELVATQGKHLLKVALQADENAEKIVSEVVALDWQNMLELGLDIPTGQADLLGYEYTTHENAPVVGGRHITYHVDQPVVWHTPVYGDIQPINEAIVTLPHGGYLIPAGWASVVLPYLQKHNVAYQVLQQPIKDLDVQELHVDEGSISFEARTFQGRIRTNISGEWLSSKANIPQGSIFVPIRQPRALLAAHLLEPVSPDSLSRWGLFNTAYEITDHISNHRQLQIAQWMFGQDKKIRDGYGSNLHRKLSDLKKEYQTRMDRDDRFRDDPEQRMDFWIREIPYHDPTFNKYPVLRTNRTIAVQP